MCQQRTVSACPRVTSSAVVAIVTVVVVVDRDRRKAYAFASGEINAEDCVAGCFPDGLRLLD